MVWFIAPCMGDIASQTVSSQAVPSTTRSLQTGSSGSRSVADWHCSGVVATSGVSWVPLIVWSPHGRPYVNLSVCLLSPAGALQCPPQSHCHCQRQTRNNKNPLHTRFTSPPFQLYSSFGAVLLWVRDVTSWSGGNADDIFFNKSHDCSLRRAVQVGYYREQKQITRRLWKHSLVLEVFITSMAPIYLLIFQTSKSI